MLRSRGTVQQAWHDQASQAATARFGRQVFLRGVVEVSNFCRENCDYCGMRRDNRNLDRFRAELDTLCELLVNHRPASITDINIQTGEDPKAVQEVVLPLIKTLRRETPLGISVCLGTLGERDYRELQAAGASIYIIKFEIADAAQYAQLHAPGTQSERLKSIRLLAEQGWRVSSGFISGLPGQGDRELLANFTLANELPLAGCSVSPFIPGDETPLANASIITNPNVSVSEGKTNTSALAYACESVSPKPSVPAICPTPSDKCCGPWRRAPCGALTPRRPSTSRSRSCAKELGRGRIGCRPTGNVRAPQRSRCGLRRPRPAAPHEE